MAKANLPVNFKDDILKENMNGKRRFNMIQNGDGTVSFEDVTEYTQVGSTFGAAQINATNTAVNNAADASKIIDNLETIKANTQSGYIAGALAVKALNSNLGVINYGSAMYKTSWSATSNFSTEAGTFNQSPNKMWFTATRDCIVGYTCNITCADSGYFNNNNSRLAQIIDCGRNVSGNSVQVAQIVKISAGGVVYFDAGGNNYGTYDCKLSAAWKH